VCAAVVDGQHLDVHVVKAAVELFVFDADIGKMDLVVEIRQVMRSRPILDLVRRAIRPATRTVLIFVALVQPTLVLALEFVIEDHPVDAHLSRLKLLRLTHVGVINLRVVFNLADLDQTGIKLLLVLLRPVNPMRCEQVSPTIRENDKMVSLTVGSLGADESLLAQVAEVAGSRIRGPSMVVSEVAHGHHAKRADDG
jgi:hypothetical protein